MNYKKELIKAINEYDESEERFEVLKDIICTISDKLHQNKDPLLKELLYIASQKIRTFGYNKLNNLELTDVIPETSYSFLYKNATINEYYTSETGTLLDKSQKMIVEMFESLEVKKLLVSAPTSFGKTFILKELIYLNAERYRNIILIFPTISLLNENVDNFIDFIEHKKLNYNIISNTHVDIEYDSNNIFILTPERVLKILNDHPNLTFDFFFMDEIYKIDNFFNIANDGESISESERDTVFRIVLYILSKNVKEYYLAVPYLNLNCIDDGFRKFIKYNDISSIQVNTEVVKKEHIISWNNYVENDDIHIRYHSNTKSGKMKQLIDYICKNNLGPTIVYAESVRKVTKLARETLYLFGNEIDLNVEVKEFIEHLVGRYSFNYKGEQIHSFWSMIDMLKRGIGTHHGAFPKYIQKEILDLFNNGYIKVLFTTTSVTEGVNTKAKNLIFYGKNKGIKELKNFDIKNINGRAGRYYHFFVGRIFYLDSAVYDKLQNEEDKLDFITFSDKELSSIDLDNVDRIDLTDKNGKRKEERDLLIASYNIDEYVFIKNRLVDRLKQIELINLLKSSSKVQLRTLVRHCSSIRAFLENSTIYTILDYFKSIGLISHYEYLSYGKIVSDYSKPNGMYELFKYHLDKCTIIDNEKIDSVYINVFSDIRNIIEFKVPKLLSVFENILIYVCSLPQYSINTDGLAFSSIIKFFELGVRTKFGSMLAEYGFPIAAIRHLEKAAYDIMEQDVKEIVNNLPTYRFALKKHLDNYENKLLEHILKFASKMVSN